MGTCWVVCAGMEIRVDYTFTDPPQSNVEARLG